jgi:fatty-acyl-CoA synthase
MSETLASVLNERRADAELCLRLAAAGAADENITYRELFEGSRRVAAFLHARGVTAGDVVFCIFPTGRPVVFSFFGAVLAGAVPAILPFPTPKLDAVEHARRLQLVSDYSRPAAVLTYQDLKEQAASLRVSNDSLRVVASWDEIEAADPGAGFTPSAATLSDSERGALLQYSSGTTGLQKGVWLSHRAVMAHMDSYARAIDLTSGDVVVSWLPLYHDMGLIATFLLPIVRGVRLVLMSPFDWVARPGRLLQQISTNQGTLTWLPNFAYNFLVAKVRDEELDGVRLDSLRAVVNCSEPMKVESHERFAARFASAGLRRDALATCYAMAENTFAVTQGGIAGPPTVDVIDGDALGRDRCACPASAGTVRPRRMLSAGTPIDGVALRILDETRQPAPERTVGEIAIRSPFMLTEYYRRPDLTDAAFDEGWYLTGDYGYVAGGELYVTGRKKDVVIVGGTNVYPQDIEAAVDLVSGVHPGRTVAFGVPDEAGGTEAVAVVAEVEAWAVDRREAIRAAIREQVARTTDCAVRHISLVERGWLLKTSSGKVARQANKDKYCRESGIFA